MLVTLEGADARELRAELRFEEPDPSRPDEFNMRRDYGYFARFPNPLNESAAVILVNGIHTAGVLGAARAFADRREALRNFHSVFNSGASPRSFECHFEVSVLHGDVRVPTISPNNIYPLGPRQPTVAQALGDVRDGKPDQDLENSGQVTVMFVAGDRGGSQRNQIQIPREFDSYKKLSEGASTETRFALSPQFWQPHTRNSSRRIATARRFSTSPGMATIEAFPSSRIRVCSLARFQSSPNSSLQFCEVFQTVFVCACSTPAIPHPLQDT